MIQVSTLHAAVVDDALQLWMPHFDPHRKNAFQVLEVLVETQAATGKSLQAPARHMLESITGNAKAGRVARQLTQNC
ncbi:hypothetical protein [Sphingomonas sp.]|uniref:hypothetical protein n=1 Tax=Sphingomonas sp. TaxID=28214 RepID=UPI003B3B18CA